MALGLLALFALVLGGMRLSRVARLDYLRGAVERMSTAGVTHYQAATEYSLRSLAGIDAAGFLLYRQPAGTHRFVAFGLRGGSLKSDLSFWEAVEVELSQNEDVHLVGFCDGPACRREVSAMPRRPRFPVMFFGEIVQLEAVAQADKAGLFLVTDGESRVLRRVPWRGTSANVSEATKEILK